MSNPLRSSPAHKPISVLADKMLQGNLMAADCPSREVLKHLTSRWGVLVLVALEQRTYRFLELKRMVAGVSERMLAQTLQALQGDGLVHRHALAQVPPHVEYSLTPLGLEAAEKVRLLANWIELRMPQIAAVWDAVGSAEPEPEPIPLPAQRSSR